MPYKQFIPNIITILNMFFGFVAITHAIDGNFNTAIWIIFLACVLDFLDGRLARMLKAHSKFGVELDSLSDLVSFGVAPSILLYEAYFSTMGLGGMALSATPMIFAALRLARFNVEWGRGDARYMKGLATPVSALALTSLLAFIDTTCDKFVYPGAVGAMVIIISLLMISNIRFDSHKVNRIRDFKQSWKFVPLFLSILTVIIFGASAMFLWVMLYIAIGISRSIKDNLSEINGVAALVR